jgi:hypothetical protein
MACQCTHSDKDHCKGNVQHSRYKDEMRMVPNREMNLCTTRHCFAPLCDCTNFREGTKCAEPAPSKMN